MRILQVARSINTVGGMEIFARRLSELLVGAGHETVMVVADTEPVEATFPTVAIGDLLAPSTEAYLAAAGRLDKVIASFKPDLVVTHHAAHGRLLTWLEARVPTVEILHGFACHGGKLFRKHDTVCGHPVSLRCLWDWYAGPCGTSSSPRSALGSHRAARGHLAALRRARGVIVGSRFMRQYAIGEGVPAAKVWVTDFDVMLPSRKAPEGGRHRSILYVGRLVYHKGVHFAIEALARLGEGYTLVIVGEGWYRAALEHRVRHLKLQEQVRFTGPLTGPALDDEYAKATVLVVPSIWPEPVGLVVPEARNSGVPVAAFDVGGLAEWATKYDGVHLARHADAASLAQAIRSASAPAGAQTSTTIAGGGGESILAVLERLAGSSGSMTLDARAQSASR